jgi:hypothetical protein
MARARSRAKGNSSALGTPFVAYSDATRQPLYCLAFLFPLIAVYEFGAMMLRPLAAPERLLLAPSFINDALAWFGAVGPWVPGAALLATLLCWHFLSGHNWHMRAWVPALMLAESVALALPLIVLSDLLMQAGALPPLSKTRIVTAIGAAIYEEALFRFALVSALIAILVDLARVPRMTASIIAGALAALIFAAMHCQPLGSEPFAWLPFILRTLAGGYLALLFIARGLGICTGAHAAYNVLTLLRWSAA